MKAGPLTELSINDRNTDKGVKKYAVHKYYTNRHDPRFISSYSYSYSSPLTSSEVQRCKNNILFSSNTIKIKKLPSK